MTNRLVGVLCRFRKEPIALTCDIEAMFHQFFVNPEQRDLLRFIWWKWGRLDSTPIEYRMTVHLFGAVSSPSCANFGLKRIAEDHGTSAPDAAGFIKQDFYVDDGLKSLSTVQEAIKLAQTSQQVLAKGGLRLHKFTSNSVDVLNAIPPEDRAQNVSNLNLMCDKLPSESALGVQWCVESDTLGFRITLQDQPMTRRGILSTVASIYDPLGFVAPFILVGKQILQEICRDGLEWDAPLPEDLVPQWERWRSEILLLENLKVPRCMKPTEFGKAEQVQLHHFSDASFRGYGACSYLRQVNQSGQVHCSLVMAKARVTPQKVMTIPRLELTAAVTASKLAQFLQQELDYDEACHFFWTDSKVVLGYIANESSQYHVFVANRVQAIRDASNPDQWRHVRTEQNPADLASRGCSSGDLLKPSIWFDGPKFLWENELPVKETVDPICDNDPEVKKHVFSTKAQEGNSVLRHLQRYSSWIVMKRIVALCRNLRKHVEGLKPCQITATDLKTAEDTIIKLVQQESFAEEIQNLSSEAGLVKKSSSVYKLDPFIDASGFLRVGGRVRASSLPFHLKHPALLPKDDHITNAILRYHHKHTAHQGRGMTTNELRSNGLWVIGASKAIARIISQCVSCRKLRGQNVGQKMADMPKERIDPAPPFTNSEMDFFGPFYIREGRKELKRWGCVFTCLASRAIHLEVATAMSTDSFLNVLRRFISLRGAVRQLRCDQGTNFVGASRELQDALKEVECEKVQRYLAAHSCEFFFNPPHASHMGGVWERQIRTVRGILSSLLADWGTMLDDDSLRTLMAETTAIVNSRPLTVDNLNDPNSLAPLTPNHLLTGKSSVILPPPGNFQRPDIYSRKRWRRVQHLANVFWSRWRKEYVQQLQSRQKWSRPQRNMTKGDIVMLVDDSLPRCQWRLARVSEAKPSQDGHVRKVTVTVGDPLLSKSGKRRSPISYLERPVHKVVLLLETEA